MTDKKLYTPEEHALNVLEAKASTARRRAQGTNLRAYRDAVMDVGYAYLKAFPKRESKPPVQSTQCAATADAPVAEPVAWAYEVWLDDDGPGHWAERASKCKPEGNEYIRNIRPLSYSHTSAPKGANDVPTRAQIKAMKEAWWKSGCSHIMKDSAAIAVWQAARAALFQGGGA